MPKKDEEGGRGGQGQGDPWPGSCMHSGLREILISSIETKSWVGILVLEEKNVLDQKDQ